MKGSKLMHRCGLGALHRALQLVKICDDLAWGPCTEPSSL